MSTLLMRLTTCWSAIVLSFTATAAAANDLPCFDDDRIQSGRVHDLQVMLMVTSLKCRLRDPATLRAYGELLDARSDTFRMHSEDVRDMLRQRYGSFRGDAAFHTYTTMLSNYHSQLTLTPELCNQVKNYIRMAQQADSEELGVISRLATSRAISQCFGPAPAPASAYAPAPGTVAQEPEYEMVDGIPTYTRPGMAPDTRPEPLERAAMEPARAPRAAVAADAPPPAPSDKDARIDQAIAALTEAANALRALQSPAR